jgi:hypothetical protein
MFSKNAQISNFVKPAESEFQADRRTDTTKLVVAFRNLAKAPTNVLSPGEVGGGVVNDFQNVGF